MKRPYHQWTTAEARIMLEVYPHQGWEAVHKLLPHRDVQAIHSFASRNRIRLSEKLIAERAIRAGNSPRWTMDERAIVAELYPDGGWKAVHERLPHRSRIAICLQASKMGVAISEELSVRQHQVSGRLGGRHRHPATSASSPPT
jgi:hypothetical protein